MSREIGSCTLCIAGSPNTKDKRPQHTRQSLSQPCRSDIAESSCRSFRSSFCSVALKQRQPAFAVGRASARPVNHRSSSSWFNPQVWDSAPPQRTYQPSRCLHRGRRGTRHQVIGPRSRRIGRDREGAITRLPPYDVPGPSEEAAPNAEIDNHEGGEG